MALIARKDVCDSSDILFALAIFPHSLIKKREWIWEISVTLQHFPGKWLLSSVCKILEMNQILIKQIDPFLSKNK